MHNPLNRLHTLTVCPLRPCLLALILPFAAQQSAAQSDALTPLAPANTSSPRETLRTFLRGCNEVQQKRLQERYFDHDDPAHRALTRRVLSCLDASELPDFARVNALAEAAVCLKEVLDRVELPVEREIPGPDEVVDADGVQLDRWQVPGTRIFIHRVEEGEQKHQYVFTPGTVGRSVEYFEDVQALPYREGRTVPLQGDVEPRDLSPGLYRWYMSAPSDPTMAYLVDRLPDWTRNRIRRLAIWQWLALSIGMVVTLLLLASAYRFQRTLGNRFRETSVWGYSLTLLLPFAAVLVPIGFRQYSEHYVGVHGTPLYGIGFVANLVALLASIVLVFSVGNRIIEAVVASPRINPKGIDAQFIRILGRLAALVVSVIVFLEGGNYLGIPLSTLLASAGVGGVAVALAAQDSLKNVFGTITLMADKPFRVGERIIVNDYDGLVESVGLRSTRIRLLSGSQVTVPNDELARSHIENVGRRPHIRRVADLHVPLDAPRAKVEAAIETIREALDDHEGMHPDYPPRVYFNEFNPDSFNVRIFYWYHPPDYWKFLAFSDAFESRNLPRI